MNALFGLLLIRVAVGLTVGAHGLQKLAGAFGGYGISGTGGFLESLGFRPGRLYAWVLALAETVGGSLLAAGLLTPLGAAAVAGVMAAAVGFVHWPKGFFAQEGGFELPAVLGLSALGIAFAGPGRYAVDGALGWHLVGTAWGVAATVLAMIGVGLVWEARALGHQQTRTGRRPRAA